MDSMMWKEKKCFQFGGFDSTYATAGYFTSIVDKDGIEHQGTYEGGVETRKADGSD